MKITLLAVAVALLLGACGSTASDTATTPTAATQQSQPAKATKAPKPKLDGTAYAASIEKAYTDTLGSSMADVCTATGPGVWQCFYDHMSADSDSRLDITLAFPGDVTKAQKKDLAKRARIGVFNLTGEQFPKLKTIVTYDSTGLDIGTTRRDQVPLLNR